MPAEPHFVPAGIERRVELANEVRDSIEIVHTAEYANFLRHFFPVFIKLLQEVPPQTSSTPGE